MALVQVSAANTFKYKPFKSIRYKAQIFDYKYIDNLNNIKSYLPMTLYMKVLGLLLAVFTQKSPVMLTE